MEDIIAVLDAAENIADKVLGAPKPVKSYLKEKLALFLADERFLESLEGNLASSGGSGRVLRLKSIIGKTVAEK